MRSIKKFVAVTAAISAIGLTAACGSNDNTTDTASGDNTPTQSSTPSPSSTMADPAADLVGPGCAAYAKAVPKGDGSVAGMAELPVAAAASNNPLLSTLVTAVSGKLNPKVDLVSTLNNGEYTVFAPVNDAFAKLPKGTIDVLKKDDKTLTSILTYHVVDGQISPTDLKGKIKTLQGGSVKIKGSGDNLKVNGANVICGGVHTANATVYLIDSVMSPPKM